jgi:hypothetical protein
MWNALFCNIAERVLITVKLHKSGIFMYSEIVGSLLASLGGATVIVGAFAHILGKIWTNRMAEATKHKFNSEFEELRSKNNLALKEFEKESDILIKEKEQFSVISKDFYQNFLDERVNTYKKLMQIKNDYIEDTEEDFTTEIGEEGGIVYHSTYKKLRKLIIERQLYVSNDLDALFEEFRKQASNFIKEADIVEAYAYIDENNPPWENEQLNEVYRKFAISTGSYMIRVMYQISTDISKLRSRIEVDKS